MQQNNDWLNWFLGGRVPERLAQATGLNAAQVRTALTHALPKQLAELQSHAATPEGERQLVQAASTIPSFGSVDAALDAAGGADELLEGGRILAPAIMGTRHDDLVRETAQHAGAGAPDVSKLLHMTLPLIVSRFSQRQGAGAVLLPPLATAASVSATPGVVVTEGAPVVPAPAPVVVQTVTTTERKGGFPWWLLLLPLLLLGGCWLTNQNKPQPAVTQEQTTPTPADFTVTTPADGATVSAEGFSAKGTGPAGGVYSIYRDDAEVGNFTVGDDGTWNVDVVDAAAPAGQATYVFRNAAGNEAATLPLTIGTVGAEGAFAITTPSDGAEVPVSGFSMQGTGPAGTAYSIYRDDAEVGNFTVGDDGTWNVDVVDAAAPAGQATYTVRDSEGQDVGTLPVTIVAGEAAAPASTTAAAADLTVTNPTDGAEVEAGGFDMSGTGTPGATFQLYEDGVSVGTFTVDDDGNWTVDVAGPGEGAHTYDILDDAGNRVATLPLTVVASTEAQTCSDNLSISLADGENVTAPFRFGGRGSGEAVLVTVWRGERQIGEQRVEISSNCTWSYLSRPGGREGVEKGVRYEVRPEGSDTVAQKVTLNVTGSGVNFNEQGEYVGPTN